MLTNDKKVIFEKKTDKQILVTAVKAVTMTL